MTQPSLTYQRKSSLLFERYQNKELTHQEYVDQQKLAEEEEIDTCVQFEMNQSRQAIQLFEVQQQNTWQKQQKEQEERRKQEEKDRQRIIAEQEQERLLTAQRQENERLENERKEHNRKMQPLLHYRDSEVPPQIKEMQARARHNRSWSSICQMMIIVTSTVAAGIVNIATIPRLVTSILTILVAIITGIVWIFKFKEKSINSQQTADAIEYERNLYRLGIKDYAGKTPQEAHVLFAERVEDLKNEQNKRQQLLEQTSDRVGGALTAQKTG